MFKKTYQRIFIWLLSGMLMCLSACGPGGEDAESLPSASNTGEDSSQSVPDANVEPPRSVPEEDSSEQEILSDEGGKERSLSIAESYRSILLDHADFINCSEDGVYQEAVNIGNIEKVFTASEDITGEVTEFAVADMDGDGENEIVLRISTGSIDEGFEVLHCQDGIVYGYHFWYRAMEELKEDGTFIGSGGAASSTINRIDFLEKGYAVDTLYESRSSNGADGVNEVQYYENGEVCSEEEFHDALERQYEKTGVTWYQLTAENAALALENGCDEPR